MGKKVLITGGAGFIGSHLTEELVKCGNDVTVLDDLSAGKEANIETLIKNGSIEFIKGSIMDQELLRKLLSAIEVIFHLAAVGSIPRSVADPETSHLINATGTFNVLLAARDCGVGKVIYSSSSSVYGDTPTLPKSEDILPVPIAPYAVAKLTGEYYCGVFQKLYGLNTVSLRYFNVYGPRQDPYSQYAVIIPKFIKSCFNGESPVIFDDGEQTRDFTFVRDVVHSNVLAESSDASGVYNISGGVGITINRLTELIIELTGSKLKPVYTEPRPGDIRHSLADISKARTFGYIPEYDMESGLNETIEWFKGS
ncbi:SDR family oxidoreductase [Chloroflexota bacterium]